MTRLPVCLALVLAGLIAAPAMFAQTHGKNASTSRKQPGMTNAIAQSAVTNAAGRLTRPSRRSGSDLPRMTNRARIVETNAAGRVYIRTPRRK